MLISILPEDSPEAIAGGAAQKKRGESILAVQCPHHPEWVLRRACDCPSCLYHKAIRVGQTEDRDFLTGEMLDEIRRLQVRAVQCALETMPNRAWKRHISLIAQNPDYGVLDALREAKRYQQ